MQGDQYPHAPVVGDGTVYLPTLSGLSARDPADGTQLWTTPARHECKGPVAVGESTVVYLAKDTVARSAVLVAADRADGAVVWTRSEDVTANVASGGLSLAGDDRFLAGRGGVLALTAGGERAWHRRLVDPDPSRAVDLVRPAVSDDRVFTFERRGSGPVYALDRATGETEWSAGLDLPADWSLAFAPVVGEEFVFVVAEGGGQRALDGDAGTPAPPPKPMLFAVDREEGTVERQWTLPGQVRGPPAVADGVLFAGTFAFAPDGPAGVHAVDVASWSHRWSATASGSLTVGPPAVTPDAVYAAQGQAVVRLDVADGSTRWSEVFDSAVGAPVVADGTLLTHQPSEGGSTILAVR
ncbi:MAG: PQQ-binding-like beta-propeller repeat protein [Halobacteriaceae archaeon]